MSDVLAVASLFSSSFLSATLFPGSSEILLVALLTISGVSPVVLVLSATFGNVLGGLTNVAMGRWFGTLHNQKRFSTVKDWLQRFGPVALLLSWLPLVGDLLCVLAGWLRMPLFLVVVFLCLGKALRYILIAFMTLQGVTLWH